MLYAAALGHAPARAAGTRRSPHRRLAAEGRGRIARRALRTAAQLAALGPQPLLIDEARLSVEVRGADRYDGTLRLGAGERPASIAWHAELEREGPAVQAGVATHAAGACCRPAASLPELQRAQIEGSVALKLDATLGAAGWQVTKLKPTLADVSVAGLAPRRCAMSTWRSAAALQPAGGRIEGWIQNAVIAAEDQRFFEHPGYELEAWVTVFKANQREGEPLQGASTITQQLAKTALHRRRRDAARKLREWLYAAEMERTLGKGRILQLYLALLPWGDGICGAEAAARHHLGKSASQLKPREATWLASLLINPTSSCVAGAATRPPRASAPPWCSGHPPAAARAPRGRARRW